VDVGPTNHEPKATASRESGRGEEAGEQTLDLMNKNRVEGMERGVSQPQMVTPEKDQSGSM
jgi:hypothetical protein